MKKLTNKEKEIMDLYWKHGPMFVRELQEHYAEPRPHFNTLSTIVRISSFQHALYDCPHLGARGIPRP